MTPTARRPSIDKGKGKEGVLPYPFAEPLKRYSAAAAFQRVHEILPGIRYQQDPLGLNIERPIAVAIGPYICCRRPELKLKKAKHTAVEEFCRVAELSREAVREKIRSVAASARSCYDDRYYNAYLFDRDSSSDDEQDINGEGNVNSGDVNIKEDYDEDIIGEGNGNSGDVNIKEDYDEEKKGGAKKRNNKEGTRFAEMLLLDGCFLLQFMVEMCPASNSRADSSLIRRAEVQTRIDAIARDIMLLENQIPWFVLKVLMEIRPQEAKVPVDRFLDLMASLFDIGNKKAINSITNDNTTTQEGAKEKQERGKQQLDPEKGQLDKKAINSIANDTTTAQEGAKEKQERGKRQLDPPPDHLLALFYRRQVGPARTESLSVPRLTALSSTAVELAEMGIKLTTSKTREFGDMSVKKRKWRGLGLGLFGELSLAPLVLNRTTACWLINMAAYEACVGATLADNFAVSSYVCLIALLMSREEDVQELRSKGIVNSEFSNQETLDFFKWAARHLRVGHRYYQVFEQLQEYKQERYVWIAVHRFFYKYFNAIAAILTIAGVLAGLFRAILSLKQPRQQS